MFTLLLDTTFLNLTTDDDNDVDSVFSFLLRLFFVQGPSFELG